MATILGTTDVPSQHALAETREFPAGTVVVIAADGWIHPCSKDYDTAVVGIVAGAHSLESAIDLDPDPDQEADDIYIATVGKVWCLADASAAPIRPGDLLTSSAALGHCRRVTEPGSARGAVIGKALTALPTGRGLVRVLVSPR